MSDHLKLVQPLRQAITINLDELKALIVEYVVECGGDEDGDLLRRLTLSGFLLWAQEKGKGTTNGKQDSESVH